MLFVQADRLIEDNQIGEATAILNEIIRDFPAFGRAYNHLAFIHETKLRDYASAEQNYRKALELAPDYPAVYLNLAILLSTLERYDEARGILDQGINIPGINKAKVLNEYGIIHEMAGDFEQALYYFKAAFQKAFSDKDMEAYQNNISRAQRKLGL